MAADRAIGIGGSSGAIEALKTILAALPSTLEAPVLITAHVGAIGLNRLADIFDAVTPLEVVSAEDGALARGGRAYVAPADHHLLVLDGVIRLGRGPRENLSRPAIDPLFRSLGLSYGSGAVGVLLSGYLNDGAAGLADLKRCGGLTVVQNPADAEVEDMPIAALRASDVDYRASAGEIAALLQRLVAAEPPAPPAHPPAHPPDDIAVEVDIALGRPVDSRVIEIIADPVALSCPACGGVLSQMRRSSPVRYRCQVGHGYTGEILATQKEAATDEAVRVALRIIEERATLMQRMADDARRQGRIRAAEMFQARLVDCRAYADTLRRAVTGV
ncbi:MAG: chemotaxis protein CheB [Caulobacterales bacterium]|nr:chemotaxis protein CheB [Caulobacterales bacterium]